MATGVRAAFWGFIREARQVGWQALLVGSGLWLQAAVCAERFVVDLADALERRRPAYAMHCSSRILGGVSERLVCAVRWYAPGARAWRRQAARTDTALLARRCLTGHRPGQTAA